MDGLSSLIDNAIKDETSSLSGWISLKIESVFNFYVTLRFPHQPGGNYRLNTSIVGRNMDSVSTSFRQVSDFLQGMGLGEVNSSQLWTESQTGQIMKIGHHQVPVLGQRHYEINLTYPQAVNQESVMLANELYTVAKVVYGLILDADSPITTEGSPFIFKQDPADGICISASGRLSIGTDSEAEARKVIQRLLPHLSDADVIKLRDYNPALLDDCPRMYEIKGHIAQVADSLPSSKFVDMFKEVHQGVEGVHCKLTGEGLIIASYYPKETVRGVPKMQQIYSNSHLPDVYARLDHVWRTFNSLTNVSLERAAEALKFQGFDQLN